MGRNFTQRQCIKRKAASGAGRYAAMPPGERLAVLAALMAAVNEKFVREKLEAAQEQLKALRQSGKVPPEAHTLFRILMPMLTLLVTVLLEKTTRKTSRNSSIRPSQMEEDDNTAQRAAQAND